MNGFIGINIKSLRCHTDYGSGEGEGEAEIEAETEAEGENDDVSFSINALNADTKYSGAE
jgi:hypothetical protein